MYTLIKECNGKFSATDYETKDEARNRMIEEYNRDKEETVNEECLLNSFLNKDEALLYFMDTNPEEYDLDTEEEQDEFDLLKEADVYSWRVLTRKCFEEEYLEREDWAVGVGGTDNDNVNLVIYKNATENEIRHLLADLVAEARSYNESCWESGTENYLDVDKGCCLNPKGLNACANFIDSHQDFSANRVKDIIREVPAYLRK